MSFCIQCGSVMSKIISLSGEIQFQCRCLMIYPGTPDDSLLLEGYIETAESEGKHDVLIEQSPFDPAANIVRKDCPECGIDFMTMIRIGINETTMYTCSCGCNLTHNQYMKAINTKK